MTKNYGAATSILLLSKRHNFIKCIQSAISQILKYLCNMSIGLSGIVNRNVISEY